MKKSSGLPDFPWDLLEPAKAKAAAHPDGLVDLSMGTPVDPVPAPIQRALAGAADAPGYPLTAGTPALRDAITRWISRFAAPGFGVLPTIGSKELVAWLPTLLGLGPGDTVVLPEVCYPTYEVGVRLCGATVSRSPVPGAALVWLNSPSNPTGRVLTRDEMAAMVAWARREGAIVASDECYLSLPWTATPTSALSVCDGDYTGVLALHSLSKRSNLAGYRAGYVSGDPSLVAELLAVRKHAGMIVPAPVQAAMIAALEDETHAAAQQAVYGARRAVLIEAVEKAGFTISHSEAGLYLWLSRSLDEDCWSLVDWFAQRGILVAPGDFYGPAGAHHVRLAFTATDERVDAAASHLAG